MSGAKKKLTDQGALKLVQVGKTKELTGAGEKLRGKRVSIKGVLHWVGGQDRMVRRWGGHLSISPRARCCKKLTLGEHGMILQRG